MNQLTRIEQETIINVDYGSSLVHIYSSQRTVYQRLVKKLGPPNKIDYIKNKIVSGSWVIPFAQKKSITQILSRPTLIGVAIMIMYKRCCCAIYRTCIALPAKVCET